MPNLRKLAKPLGVISAGVCLVLWAYLAITSRNDPVQSEAAQTAAIMGLVAVIGVVATLFERPFLMIVIFLFSFFPIGLYLLGVPSIFMLIGICNLLYLVASAVMLYDRYMVKK